MDDFMRALPVILRSEGGFVDDPDDPGGATNKGIIQKTYDGYRDSRGVPRQSVKLITDAEVFNIYFSRFWVRGQCDKMWWPLSLIHFDSCVNSGTTQSMKLLQRALQIVDDGVFGPVTMAEIKRTLTTKPMEAPLRYLLRRVFFYNSLDVDKPQLTKFLTGGWLGRVELLYKEIK